MPFETGFRISDWDTPLRVNPNRSPGRYNRAGSPATQYIGLHPLTPWAEYLRYHALRHPADIAERRLRIWALRIEIDDAVAIGFENAREQFGLEPEDLVADDHSACQALADRLREDPSAPKTMVVPSAALPGTSNLVVLGARVAIPYLWTPLDDGDVPACILADRSGPPAGLSSRVRFPGEPHAELDAWRAGRRYEFADLEPLGSDAL